jgi:hypothetical protein
MNGCRLHGIQYINGCFLDELRCGDIGIAQAEVVDILLPYLSRPLTAKFKDGTDG